MKTCISLLPPAALPRACERNDGTSVMVLPGGGRSFDDFRADEASCRATHSNRPEAPRHSSAARPLPPGRPSAPRSVPLPAAIGGQQGAAVGAGSGLIVGSAVGIDNAQQAGYGTQRQYDNAYVQCMYAKGHRVPVPAGMASAYVANSPASGTPHPPSGNPPPPPPDLRR